jgi:hypothetical protein
MNDKRSDRMAATSYVAEYSATDLNKAGGKVLDQAGHGAVRITRRSTGFVLMREDYLEGLLEKAKTGQPQHLADLLRDYDAAKIRALARSFVEDPAAGKEVL